MEVVSVRVKSMLLGGVVKKSCCQGGIVVRVICCQSEVVVEVGMLTGWSCS